MLYVLLGESMYLLQTSLSFLVFKEFARLTSKNVLGFLPLKLLLTILVSGFREKIVVVFRLFTSQVDVFLLLYKIIRAKQNTCFVLPTNERGVICRQGTTSLNMEFSWGYCINRTEVCLKTALQRCCVSFKVYRKTYKTRKVQENNLSFVYIAISKTIVFPLFFSWFDFQFKGTHLFGLTVDLPHLCLLHHDFAGGVSTDGPLKNLFHLYRFVSDFLLDC